MNSKKSFLSNKNKSIDGQTKKIENYKFKKTIFLFLKDQVVQNKKINF